MPRNDSIPDLAALIASQFRSLAARVDEIKSLGGDWTTFHLHAHALDEQARISLQNTLSTLYSFEQLLSKQTESLRHERKQARQDC